MQKKKPSGAEPANIPENNQPGDGQADAEQVVEEPLAAEMADAAKSEQQADFDPLELLRAELEEAKERALRSQAELENFRKRAARQLQEERRYANLPLIRDLLPALDNIERAIGAAEKTHDTASLLDGVKIVARQFEGVFEKHDCVRIEALNEPFDPHRHEAISQQPCDDHPAGTVVLVTQVGYRLHDRVVRPSQVIVSAEK